MMNDNDMINEKIIAVPVNDPSWNSYSDISELPQHMIDEMRHFFRVYKELEGKNTVVLESNGPDEAKQIIENAINRYQEVFEK